MRGVVNAYRDIKNSIDWAEKKGEMRGEKRGEKRGEIRGEIRGEDRTIKAIEMIYAGATDKEIQVETNMNLTKIQLLRNKLTVAK